MIMDTVNYQLMTIEELRQELVTLRDMHDEVAKRMQAVKMLVIEQSLGLVRFAESC